MRRVPEGKNGLEIVKRKQSQWTRPAYILAPSIYRDQQKKKRQRHRADKSGAHRKPSCCCTIHGLLEVSKQSFHSDVIVR